MPRFRPLRGSIALVAFAILFTIALPTEAEIKPAVYDLGAVRDAATLDIRVIQDWKPAAKEPAIRQKLIEITVCEWWAGQKVRLPVTFNAPAQGGVCTNVLLGNMGLGLKPALPTGSELRLLKEHGVGVVLVGMGTIDAMVPVGKLHLGMKEQLLKTKDARFTPAWIWGLSDMRALTAAIAEREVFQPLKVLATGGSKRGIGSAAAGIHDDRFTAIMPVVAPPLGNPGGAFVLGTDPAEITQLNQSFLVDLAAGKYPQLPATAREALLDRDARRGNERITVEQARGAGWSEAEIATMNDRAWDISRTTSHFDRLQKRGLEIFYNLGADDNVTPDLLDVGRRFPAFPLYIVPGGQHGGPKTTGFTRQVPAQPEVEANFYTFALHHFFGTRALVATPKAIALWDGAKKQLHVTVSFGDRTEPQQNELWWSIDRHPAGSLPYEYDAWQSAPLKPSGNGSYTGVIVLPAGARTVDFLSTHTHTVKELPLAISSALQRFNVK